MEIYDRVAEIKDMCSVKTIPYKKYIPQLKNFEATEIVERPYESPEINILGTKAIVFKKCMPQLISTDAVEVSEMLKEPGESNILGKVQDIHEKGYAFEENVFEVAKKTVEDMVDTVEVLEEDIMEPVAVVQEILDTITVIEDDILEKVTVVAESIVPFVKSPIPLF